MKSFRTPINSSLHPIFFIFATTGAKGRVPKQLVKSSATARQNSCLIKLCSIILAATVKAVSVSPVPVAYLVSKPAYLVSKLSIYSF